MSRRKATGTAGDVVDAQLTTPVTNGNGSALVEKRAVDIITYEPIQINNYNLTELKNTLDDAVKRVS